MSERALWDWLRGILPRGHFSRIEAPETAPGFPDVHYTLFAGTGSGTLELKFSKHPNSFTPFKRDGLRQSQIDWMRLETGHGGVVWIVGQVGSKVYWVHGVGAEVFNDFNIDQLEEFASLVHPRRKVKVEHIRKMRMLMEYTYAADENMYVHRQKRADQVYRMRADNRSVPVSRSRRTGRKKSRIG